MQNPSMSSTFMSNLLEANAAVGGVHILHPGQTWPDGKTEPRTMSHEEFLRRYTLLQHGRSDKPAEVLPGQLSELALGHALGVFDHLKWPGHPPPVKLADAAALDALTSIRKLYGSFKPEYITMSMFNLLGGHPHWGSVVQVCDFKNDRETQKCTVPWLVQLTGWPSEEWTEEQERAYVQGVLKGLVQPELIVNVVRGEGRLLSGVCRLRALAKWLRNQLSVVINGIVVSRLQLPDADRKSFDTIAIRVTLYSHLPKADELELLQGLACPAWQ
jgi:hypothetical protein